jgi:hypothetical protein
MNPFSHVGYSSRAFSGAFFTPEDELDIPSMSTQRQAKWLKHGHAFLTIVWLVMIPVALATGWIYSIVFVSAISIYANVAGHFSAWQAARAEESVERSS